MERREGAGKEKADNGEKCDEGGNGGYRKK